MHYSLIKKQFGLWFGNQYKLVCMNKNCMATVSGVTSQGGYLYPPADDGGWQGSDIYRSQSVGFQRKCRGKVNRAAAGNLGKNRNGCEHISRTLLTQLKLYITLPLQLSARSSSNTHSVRLTAGELCRWHRLHTVDFSIWCRTDPPYHSPWAHHMHLSLPPYSYCLNLTETVTQLFPWSISVQLLS